MQRAFAAGCLAGAVLTLGLGPAAGEPVPFEASGVVRETEYFSSGRVVINITIRFEVAVHGAEWFIRTHYGENHWREFGSDGTNVFSVLHDLALPGSRASLVRPATIFPGTSPKTSPWGALVWLAYASAPHFDLDGNAPELPAPWFNPKRDILAHALRAHTTVFDAAARLPARLEFRTDQERMASAHTNRMLEPLIMREYETQQEIDVLRLVAPGFIAGEFEVLSWTNLGNLQVPSRFKATRRAFPDPDLPGGWVHTEYFGELESLRTTPPRNSHLPEIAGWEILVSDRRLRDKEVNLDAVNYRIGVVALWAAAGGVKGINLDAVNFTNGIWPVTLGAEHKALFGRVRGDYAMYYQGREPGVNRKLVLALLLVTLAVPGIFLLSRHLKSRQPK